MIHYIAIIHKDADSAVGVSFPDLPGCITAASSLEAARHMAEEALQLHVRGMMEDRQPLPDPSSLDEIMADPDFQDGVAIVVALKAAPKSVRVNITLHEDVLQAVDSFAEAHGYTRSGFLAAAARKAMEGA